MKYMAKRLYDKNCKYIAVISDQTKHEIIINPNTRFPHRELNTIVTMQETGTAQINKIQRLTSAIIWAYTNVDVAVIQTASIASRVIIILFCLSKFFFGFAVENFSSGIGWVISSSVTPWMSHSLIKFSRLGIISPVSHLEMVLSEYCNLFASSLCVKFLCLRSDTKFVAKISFNCSMLILYSRYLFKSIFFSAINTTKNTCVHSQVWVY